MNNVECLSTTPSATGVSQMTSEADLMSDVTENKIKISSKQKKKTKQMDMTFKLSVWIAAGLLCTTLLLIIAFVGKTGFLVFDEVTPMQFFFSFEWIPEEGFYGAGLFIVGTLYLTALSLLISVPISLCIAIFNAFIAPKSISRILRPTLDIMVGIPSVVYGFIGLTVVIPVVRQATGELLGDGLLVSAIVLAFMVMPTIARLSEDALTSLPAAYKEAAYALGATRMQAVVQVMIPAAKNGIMTAIVLGMARAIGETMAVVMVIGNVAQMPETLFTPTAVLTSNIVSQIMNVQFDSTWNYALYMMAFILLIISLILILFVNHIRYRGGEKI